MVEGAKVAETVSKIRPDLILLDLKLPDVYGIEILRDLKKRNYLGPVIIITGNVSAGVAIESMKEGAYDYLPKPFSLEDLGKLVHKLLGKGVESQAPSSFSNGHYEQEQTGELVGRSSAILRIGKLIGQAASSDAPLLLTGERGIGKELIAKIIHQNSKRKEKPFVVINCAHPSPDTPEEVFFGHDKRTEEEVFEQGSSKSPLCSGGTILLNDIGSMSLSTQDKLLRALKKKEFGMAGNEIARVDVRIMAASLEDLSKRVSQGKFLQELFYALRVIFILVPALRDRKSDIPLLVEYFLDKYCRETGKVASDVSPDAMKLLMGYSWPGNVSELENNVYSAVVMCKGGQILPEHLPIFFEGNVQTQLEFQTGKDDYSYLFMQTLDPIGNRLFQDLKGRVHDRLIGSLERALISMALKCCRGSQAKAADLLGISRNTLRERILKFGMSEKEKPTGPMRS
jgi:DNA-binding NtrC family response regulator